MELSTTMQQIKIASFLVVPQIIFIILYGVFVEYDEASGGALTNSTDSSHFNSLYPMFQDVHVMILVGFGFLMTFLKRYGYSSVSFNLVLAAFVIQWSILIRGFLEIEGFNDGKINVSLESLLNADFAAATVLISFGAVLGVLSPIQLIVMAFVEVVFYSVNEYVIVGIFQISDIGGSMVIHTFGAYFGLAVSILHWRDDLKSHQKESSEYHSDLFAIIGTVFLWLFWPSFNAAPAAGTFAGQRAAITTVYSLSAATVLAFALSSLLEKSGKISMVHIQNATLAGGVAVGAVANLRLGLLGSVAVGGAAGAISVFGYRYITPAMQRAFHLHDTCGVHNLHGLPGVFSGVVAVILARYTNQNTFTAEEVKTFYPGLSSPPFNFTHQASMQIAGLATTLGIAIVGGLITGLALKIPFFDRLNSQVLFEDDGYWMLPSNESIREDNETPMDVLEKNGNDSGSSPKENSPSHEQAALTEVPT